MRTEIVGWSVVSKMPLQSSQSGPSITILEGGLDKLAPYLIRGNPVFINSIPASTGMTEVKIIEKMSWRDYTGA
jgi:hypothetical protein